MQQTTLWIDHEESGLYFDFYELCLHHLDAETGVLALGFRGGLYHEVTDPVVAQGLSGVLKEIRASIVAQQTSPILRPN